MWRVCAPEWERKQQVKQKLSCKLGWTQSRDATSLQEEARKSKLVPKKYVLVSALTWNIALIIPIF